MTRATRLLAAATTAATLALTACGTTPATGTAPPAAASTPAASTPVPSTPSPTAEGSSAGSATGAYIDYADYQASGATNPTVVLFFHAPWCPTCRATEKALAEQGIPDGLTLVRVDYDSMTDLRQRYGITQQHTFVLVDASGNELRKWSGSITGAEILERATSS